MGTSKVASSPLLFYLDASGIVNGANFAPAQCRTTPAVVAEFRPGGATRRRLEHLLAAGMPVVEASPAALERVRRAAESAGSLTRLSAADVEVAAACLDAGSQARLVTDDHTLLDVAGRVGIAAQPVATRGIEARLDWAARCTGCGRSYEATRAGGDCPVCGRPVVLRPQARSRKGSDRINNRTA